MEQILPHDGIDCRAWLEEMGLGQYEEVLLANFSLNGSSKFLIKTSIYKIRVTDLVAKLNMTNYEHQRIFMEQIQRLFINDNTLPDIQPFVPTYEVYDPNKNLKCTNEIVQTSPRVSKDTAEMRESSNNIITKSGGVQSTSSNGQTCLPLIRTQTLDETQKNQGNVQTDKKADPQARVFGRHAATRRRSFDEQAWNAIAKHKHGKDKESKSSALEQLRNGATANQNFDPLRVQQEKDEKKTSRQRRNTYGENTLDQDSRSRALMFGNKAQEFDKIQRELKEMQDDILGKCKKIIGCETASILFLNAATRELMIYVETKQWIRVPVDKSIAGACVTTGQIVLVPDAYADARFNRSVDLATGYRTRNVLCAPVRSLRHAGNFVAVIEMINKISPDGFDDQDVLVLQSFVDKVADSLDSQFKDLMGVTSIIGDIGAVRVDPNHKYDVHTVASQFKWATKDPMARSELSGGGDPAAADRLEAVREEKQRRQRRLSYSASAASSVSAGPVLEATTTTTQLPVLLRKDSEVKPRWVGKTARMSGEGAVPSDKEKLPSPRPGQVNSGL